MGKPKDIRGDNRTNGDGSDGGKWSKYRDNRTRTPIRWSDIDCTELAEAIDAVTSGGDALLCGRSRDGGVLVLTVCYGEERAKFYAKSASEMAGILRDLTEQALDRHGARPLEDL